jgi:hypothetical protein
MKRILIAAILGIAASASTYAQGWIQLNTWYVDSYSGAPVLYGNAGSGGTVGMPIGGNYNVQVAYFVGTGIVDPAGPGDLLASWLLDAAIRPEIFDATGEFGDPVVYTLPNYPSTGGVPVQLELLVFTGSSYASSTIRGHSAAFSLSSAAVGTQYPPLMDDLRSFSIYLIPEPSGLALAGLGAVALMIYRRRET